MAKCKDPECKFVLCVKAHLEARGLVSKGKGSIREKKNQMPGAVGRNLGPLKSSFGVFPREGGIIFVLRLEKKWP